MEPVILRDDVVLLSAPTLADVDAITSACQDPEVATWTTVPTPYRREHAEGFVTGMVADGWRTGGELVWAVREADGTVLGMVGLHGVRDGGAEVGYWLAPGARGRGVLHRALLLVLQWAFDAPDGPGLQVVAWRAFAGNWPSWRAVWRVGFRFDGVARLGVARPDGRRDDWMGSLLAGEPREPSAPWPATALPALVPPPGPVLAVPPTR